jgi:predicted transcriptional regulator
MPCISPDGKPTSSGMALLRALKEGASSPEDVASKTGRSIYLVRSGLRELKSAGYVEEEGENRYRLTDKGAALLK